MADYGIEVYNFDNILVIDSQYKNHIYHSHGRSFVQQYMNIIDIPDLTSTGIVFIKPTTFFTKAFGFEKNGDVYDKILIASDSTGYIDWIVYEDIQTEPSGEYGFNVYDSSASIVFSSLETGYLNVIDDKNYSPGENKVQDADNHYFSISGKALSYNIQVHIFGGTRTATTTRRITGMKYKDSTTLEIGKFTYNIEVVVSADPGSGLVSLSHGYAASPQKLIELKKPPSI